MSTQLDRLLDVASGISRGEIPLYQHNECFTSGAFDLLLVHVRDAEAFQLLQDACGRYEALKASRADMGGYYLLLSLLARQSNTTEMPNRMTAIIQEHPALSADLREWYRHEG
jgi:hypothetical protein